MCHLVLLLPVFGLVVFWLFPLPVAISAWMYMAVMPAMNQSGVTGPEGMIGLRGEVIGLSAKDSEIFVHGEVWRGKSQTQLHVGEHVRVVGLHKLALRVEDAKAQSDCGHDSCGMKHKFFFRMKRHEH